MNVFCSARRATPALSLLLLLLPAFWAIRAAQVGSPSHGGLRASAPAPRRLANDAADRQRAGLAWSQLPLRFEANAGQTDPRVCFVSRGPGYTLYLTDSGTVLTVTSGTGPAGRAARAAAVRMRLLGARPGRVEGTEQLAGRSHYLLGADPRAWRTDVPNYRRVRLRGVYRGVDLDYYGNQGRLEYDFTLAPGSDPAAIRMALDGADGARVDAGGDLCLATAAGEIRQEKPVAYQFLGGQRREVECEYVLQPVSGRVDDGTNGRSGGHTGRLPSSTRPLLHSTTHEVGFRLGAYDRNRPLVIDPVLGFSTYLGGSGVDMANGIGLDGSGSATIVGQTTSLNFPIEPGAIQATARGGTDAFVARLNPFAAADQALVYSTYLGGSGQDVGTALAVDGSGGAYVVGQTTSTNFPVTTSAFRTTVAGQADGFLARLGPGGAPLVYSTYLGGSVADAARGVAIDGTGRAFVVGDTFSTDFPVLATAFFPTYRGNGDAFLSILNTAGSGAGTLLYSSFLGGTGGDAALGVAASGTGAVHLTGRTASSDFPTSANGAQRVHGGAGDAFVLTLNPGAARAAQVVYGTYLGGTGTDNGSAVAIDPTTGRVVVTGQTFSTTFPTTTGAYRRAYAGSGDAFVTALDPLATSSLFFSTYLGATGIDAGTAVAVDSTGNAHVTGSTRSADFPTVDAVQSTFGGTRDAFVTELDSTGSVLSQSTFLGGSGDDGAQGIALDASGAVWVAGGTASANFPIAGNAPQTASGGGTDAFVARIRPGQTVQFNAASYSVAENAGQVSVTVTRSGGGSTTASVQVTTSNGSAGAGSDYTTTSGTVVFAPGETSHTFAIPILDDATTEASETFTVTLSSPTGGVEIGIPSTATVTIVDNDGAGRVQFSAAAFQANENAGSAPITVVRTGSLAGTASVRFTASGGSATASSDFAAVSGTLSFASGESSKSFAVPIVNDSTAEVDETVNLTLSSPAGATLGSPVAAVLTIVDDDNRGTLLFSPSAYRPSESGGLVTLTVLRSGSTTAAASVRFSTTNGGATAGSDYTSTSGTLNFAAGQTSQSFTIPILNDSTAEGDETFNVTLNSPSGAVLGTPATATVTIVDDDGRGTLQFSADSYRVTEGAGRAAITVTRLGGSAGTVSVGYVTSNGSAVAGTDFTSTSGSLTFNAGETSKTFFVTILQDSAREADETLVVTLRNPSTGALLGKPNTATVTIVDDDQVGTLQFSAAEYTVAEGGARVTIAVTRGGGTVGSVTVRFATSNGTATSSTDYSATAGTLTFNSGETVKTFTVTVLQDSLVEPDETVNLTLSSPTGGALLGTPSTAVLTIRDDDGRGSLQFSSTSYLVGEEDGAVTVTVLRTGGSRGTASVRVATSNGTATAPPDFASTSVLVSFADGETSRTVSIPIREDTLIEPNETVNLTLSTPTGAVLGSPTTAVITIRDNDGHGSLQFDSPSYSVDESAGLATITVTRTGGSAGSVSVRFATTNGTATAGSDFTSTSGTLTFNSGETIKTFSVAILNNTLSEPDETLTLTLSNPLNGAVLGSPSTATLTIRDDDRPGTLQFSATNYSQLEADVPVTVTVTRLGGSRGTVSVRYATSSGTASGGLDYTSASGTLTFADGETSKTFTVTLRQDTVREADESLNLTLSSPAGGATLGTPSTATITILNDD